MDRQKSSTTATGFPCLALLTICSFFFACQKPPRSRGEAVSRMVQLQESGHYDEAVRVVQDWMSRDKKDPSHDDFLHLQIAIVYTVKAYHKQSTRDESLRKAASHLEQALTLYDSKQPGDVDDMLLGIGVGYEVIGDLSEKQKCEFYGKARAAYERQLPLIKGDSYTAYGTTVPLEPLRTEVRKHLTSVEEKFTHAGCRLP
jgi:hypothetical protein